jgi:hypothetical protein
MHNGQLMPADKKRGYIAKVCYRRLYTLHNKVERRTGSVITKICRLMFELTVAISSYNPPKLLKYTLRMKYRAISVIAGGAYGYNCALKS